MPPTVIKGSLTVLCLLLYCVACGSPAQKAGNSGKGGGNDDARQIDDDSESGDDISDNDDNHNIEEGDTAGGNDDHGATDGISDSGTDNNDDESTGGQCERKPSCADLSSAECRINPCTSGCFLSDGQCIQKMSHGKGGETGSLRKEFTTTNGKSSYYRIVIPEDIAETQYGLLVYLHGDGGYGVDEYVKSLPPYLEDKNLITVTIKCPTKSWWADGIPDALFVHEIIQNDILKNYNIDRSRIFFAGISGGSEHLTSYFIPRYGKFYNSGALVMCGGGVYRPDDLLSIPEETRTLFKIYVYISKNDWLYDRTVKKGIDRYNGINMNIETDFSETGGHCEFKNGTVRTIDNLIPKIDR